MQVHRGEGPTLHKSGLNYSDRSPAISEAMVALGREAVVDRKAVMPARTE